MLSITLNLLTNDRNRPFLRDKGEYALRELRGIVAHWTANTAKGADAKANRNYFNNVANFASAHYVIDDQAIVQCIPDNEVAYHVGAKQYRPDGERLRGEGDLSPNYFLVGFEMCVNEDGDWEKTYKNSVALAAHLLYKYRFSTGDLYRHYDITGKDCPKMMLTGTAWSKFKSDIAEAMNGYPLPRVAQGRVRAGELNVRSGPGISNPVAGKLKQGDLTDIFEENDGWLRIGERRWVSKNYVDIVFQTQLGRANDPTGANVRSGPGTNFPVVDALPNGALVNVTGRNANWLEISDNRWINTSLITLLLLQNAEVNASKLNVRSGPDASFPAVRQLRRGERVQFYEEKNRWLRIAPNEWVYRNFVKIL